MEEEKEVEVLEFSLDDSGIEELMGKLNELRHTGKMEFDIDDEYSLEINYDGGENE